MTWIEKLQRDGNKGAERAAAYVIKRPNELNVLVDTMGADVKRLKNAAGKAVRIISERKPELLWPVFDCIRAFVGDSDKCSSWTAIRVVGNLAEVDRKGRIDAKTMNRLFDLLADEAMVTSANAIEALGKIAVAKPRQRSRITRELARVESIKRNRECRDILIGKTLDAYRLYAGDASKTQLDVMEALCRRNVKNSRPATRKRAATLVNQLGGA